MNRVRKLGAMIVAGGLLLQVAPAAAQESVASPRPGQAEGQLASGVIVRSEAPEKSGEAKKGDARSIRLTINTAAVWRDWVRDQATTKPKTPREAAKKGQESVATRGEPRSDETLVVVEITPETKIETRYRSATDSVSEGAKTPEGADEAEKSIDAASKTDASGKDAPKANAKAVTFDASQLEPGLFVEVDYRKAGGKDRASRVRVVRPVGGSTIPAGEIPKP